MRLLFSACQRRNEVHSGYHTLTLGMGTFKIFFSLYSFGCAPQYYLKCQPKLEFTTFFFSHSLFSIDILALVNSQLSKVSSGQSAKIVIDSIIRFIDEPVIIMIGQWTLTAETIFKSPITMWIIWSFFIFWRSYLASVSQCAIVLCYLWAMRFFHRIFCYFNYQ